MEGNAEGEAIHLHTQTSQVVIGYLRATSRHFCQGGGVRVGHEFSVQAMYSKAAVEEVTHCI